MRKTWIPLLTHMHIRPGGLSLPTFAAPFLSTPHLTLHTVAIRSSFHLLKAITYHLGPQDLCICCLL